MKDRAVKIIGFLMIVCMVVAFAHIANAEDTIANNAMRKLGRGCANILTCWLEIPHQIGTTNEKEGSISGWTVGLIKGVVMTGVRAVVGAYEVVTFPVPLPARYKPILQYPEFFLEPETL